MFTGIIQEIGTVARVERSRGLVRLTIYAPTLASRVGTLESVAMNGVCLTVVTIRHGTVAFEVIPETQRLTNLGTLRRGDRVNLEPSLTIADRFNGHIVLGHVDGQGVLVKRRQLAGELILEIRVPVAVRTLLVPKGPVTVDGVSLPVGKRLTRRTFHVHLIPETLRRTTLEHCRNGDHLNIEFDYLAKLVQQFLHP